MAEPDPHIIMCDAKSSAAPLRPLLAEQGIEAEVTNAAQFVLACGGLVDDIEAAKVSHTNQHPLTTAIGAAGKRELPSGGWAWNRKTADGSPITALVAATLAHFGLLSTPVPQPKRRSLPPLSDTGSGGHREEPFRDLDKTPF